MPNCSGQQRAQIYIITDKMVGQKILGWPHDPQKTESRLTFMYRITDE